jgi:hypothetical protein
MRFPRPGGAPHAGPSRVSIFPENLIISHHSLSRPSRLFKFSKNVGICWHSAPRAKLGPVPPGVIPKLIAASISADNRR